MPRRRCWKRLLPVVAGHEGSGIVEEVGPHIPGWAAGDHVVTSFVPSCARCRWCASGMQTLSVTGAGALWDTREDAASSCTTTGG
jgi:Zn-dependent alcohol dehydrogenase